LAQENDFQLTCIQNSRLPAWKMVVLVSAVTTAAVAGTGLPAIALFAISKKRSRREGAKAMETGIFEKELSVSVKEDADFNESITHMRSSSPPIADSKPSDIHSSLPPFPWGDGLSCCLQTCDLARVSCACTQLREELTIPNLDSPNRRSLLASTVELRIETAEAELQRVSLPHVVALRVWGRLSFNALAAAVAKGGPNSLRSLERLSCKGCALYAADVDRSLTPILVSTRGLQLLNLEKSQVSDATVEHLCASGALSAGRVETLNLRFNKIGDAGAIALASCPGVACLKWINLKMNSVGVKGASALASMLHNNRSIKLLNLRKQVPGLPDEAALSFAEALKSNCVLEQLRLRRNKISDVGAVALAEAAAIRLQRRDQVDCHLELDLEDNRIGEKGALALFRSGLAAPATARVEFLLSGNPITQSSLNSAAVEIGEVLDVSGSRVHFNTKPEGEL